MKCFICKTKIGWAHRTYYPARSMREKAQFRDLCDPCFVKHQHDKGYVQTPEGHWEKSKESQIKDFIGSPEGQKALNESREKIKKAISDAKTDQIKTVSFDIYNDLNDHDKAIITKHKEMLAALPPAPKEITIYRKDGTIHRVIPNRMWNPKEDIDA